MCYNIIMSKILIIEDDPKIRAELKTLLENNDYVVAALEDFSDVGAAILNSGADLVLLDINLPGINGEMVLKNLRKTFDIPVIMVTSKDTEMDEALSISYGADDFIAKPYNPNILLLRIGAVLKRSQTPTLEYQGLKYDASKGELSKNDQKIALTKNEMLIFNYLLQNNNRIVSRSELMTLLWNNESYLNDSTLTTNISRLREKLAKIGVEDAIQTRKGQGYLLNLAQ